VGEYNVSFTEWAVVIAGCTAIGWVNWYFFFAGRSATTIAGRRTSKQER